MLDLCQGSPQTFACARDALSDSPAETAFMGLRSDLLAAIVDTVESLAITRLVVAKRLELKPLRLDELLRGSADRFTMDELIELTIRAHIDVRAQRVGRILRLNSYHSHVRLFKLQA